MFSGNRFLPFTGPPNLIFARKFAIPRSAFPTEK
jgi:hypothetical protein